MDEILDPFRRLTDEQLHAEAHLVVDRERTATTIVIACLVEVDRREMYLARGYSSLYAYCTRELHLSESAAYSRISAARVARTFPMSLGLLADGSLTLTNVNLLAPHLTVRNHAAQLEAARFKTSREVREQIAALNPDLPARVAIHMQVRLETQDKLRHAQDLLRHTLPSGDVAEIFDRALTVLIADLEKKKLAQVARPRRARPIKMTSRHISAAVRRAVNVRDEGRCAFVGKDGRCTETGFLEFHHIKPFARGGLPTVENIQLRCRAHNQYEGERAFGSQRVKNRGAPRSPPDVRAKTRRSSSG